MTVKQQQKAAKAFMKRWTGSFCEKSDANKFWRDLLENVLSIDTPDAMMKFEYPVNRHKSLNIDIFIPSRKAIIENKSSNVNLDTPIKQSNGKRLTPFEQAKNYDNELRYELKARWIITCNFKEIRIYDMNEPEKEPNVIWLKDLDKDFHRLNFLVDPMDENVRKETELSIKAGDIVGEIYDKLFVQYGNPTDEKTLNSLNQLCVRLVFCLYAEDAGIFKKNQFYNFLAKHSESLSDFRTALENLFVILNQRKGCRKQFLMEGLKYFDYVNGGLFADEIEIPQFTEKLKKLIMQKASLDFDWSEISPTIFGALFESTLNPGTRRNGGMHYTSIENIHKVIDPLFLNGLKAEYKQIKDISDLRRRNQELIALQKKMGGLRFLDPACGSGNFLTETYLSLRKLENEILASRNEIESVVGKDELFPIYVGINQFYGIEINDFAVAVARAALWIAENQMLQETEKRLDNDIGSFLPLKSYSNIQEGNALTMAWEKVVPPKSLSYIIGNPPFTGARKKSKAQGEDLRRVFGENYKQLGDLDYVSGWYRKAVDMMKKNRNIRTALVSTNSICQGEQVAPLWIPLLKDKVHIDFAYRTFRWDSEAKAKAHVHCIIVGFSRTDDKGNKIIFDSNGTPNIVSHINPYLFDGPDILVWSASKSLSGMPEIGIGNKPIDGGYYLFTKEEKDNFIKKEPLAEQYFKEWYGAEEFINRQPRYCLWLGDCTPHEIASMPHALTLVEKVKVYRAKSSDKETRSLSETPTHFHIENMPVSDFILIPCHSSENRKYIPMGYMSNEVLASNATLLIPCATNYHLGVLMSSAMMVWVQYICGSLEKRYRYSAGISYNPFPWPQPTEEQRKRIEKTAQEILDARAEYPDSSMHELYNTALMPDRLRMAHTENDKAVLSAYGFDENLSGEKLVIELLKLYKKLQTKKKKRNNSADRKKKP